MPKRYRKEGLEVERFSVADNHMGLMFKDSRGEWVRFSDFQACCRAAFEEGEEAASSRLYAFFNDDEYPEAQLRGRLAEAEAKLQASYEQVEESGEAETHECDPDRPCEPNGHLCSRYQPEPVEEGQSFEDISLLTATWGNGGKLRALTVKTPEGTVRLIPEPVEEESEVGQARHALKCWPPHFEHVLTGQKTFEVRSIADHTFEVGDTLLLREYDGVLKHRAPETEGYTGRTCKRTITYILGDGDWGIDKGTVVLALAHSQHSTEEGEADLHQRALALVAAVLEHLNHELTLEAEGEGLTEFPETDDRADLYNLAALFKEDFPATPESEEGS